MANSHIGAPQSDRVREIEMRLWEEVGTQLKGVTEAMRDLTHEMRDVRERLIRMEAQDQPAKIAKLEADLRAAEDHISDVRQDAHNEMLAVKQTAADDKLALEKRLTRMEVIIAPLTVGGSAFLAAVIGAIVTMVTGASPGG